MKNLLLILILKFVCNQIATENRICDCRLQYEVSNNTAIYKPLEKLFTTEDAEDKKDKCDFRCTDWCANEIRNEINIEVGSNQITNLGRENICETVFPKKSLVKDGIVLKGWWHLHGCADSDNQESVILDKKICCRHCQCQLAYLNPRSANYNDAQIETNFSSLIFNKHNNVRAYDCEELNHLDECENDCREFASKKLNYTVLTTTSLDQYDPLRNRQDSDQICEVLNRTINSPGINLIVRYETGPRSESIHKDISLGNICCQRTCNCELIYRVKNKNETIEDCKLDLTYRLPKRPLSYYCDDELKECIDDCKIAAGLSLRNEPIKNINLSVLDMNIFDDFLSARKACMIYNKTASKPKGFEVFLRYSTGNSYKQLFPYGQDLYLGKLCCDTYFYLDLFPYNNCEEVHWNNVPFNEVDDNDPLVCKHN